MTASAVEVSYKSYGVVEVLAVEGGLTKIRAACNDTEFWVSTDKLKTRTPRVAGVRKKIDPEAPPEIAPSADPFFHWLLETGCHISAQVPEAVLEKFIGAYEKATGEAFVDAKHDSIFLRNNKPWGYSLMVRFSNQVPSNLRPASAVTKPKWADCLFYHNNAFVLELLAAGFRFGYNQPAVKTS